MSEIKKEAVKTKTGTAAKRGRPKKVQPEQNERKLTEIEIWAEKNKENVRARYFTQRFPLPIVFICSPIGEKRELDEEKAKRYSRFAVSKYCVPVTPHLLYPRFLWDDVVKEKNIGRYCGWCLLDKCSEIWVFGDVLTNDMEWEIWRAFMRSKKIRWFTEDLVEVQRVLPDKCKSLMGPRVKKPGRRKKKKEKEAV